MSLKLKPYGRQRTRWEEWSILTLQMRMAYAKAQGRAKLLPWMTNWKKISVAGEKYEFSRNQLMLDPVKQWSFDRSCISRGQPWRCASMWVASRGIKDLFLDYLLLYLPFSEINPIEKAPVLCWFSFSTSSIIVLLPLAKESTPVTHFESYFGALLQGISQCGAPKE